MSLNSVTVTSQLHSSFSSMGVEFWTSYNCSGICEQTFPKWVQVCICEWLVIMVSVLYTCRCKYYTVGVFKFIHLTHVLMCDLSLPFLVVVLCAKINRISFCMSVPELSKCSESTSLLYPLQENQFHAHRISYLIGNCIWSEAVHKNCHIILIQ